MESNLFGKDKKPANYFYGISKPTRYSPSRCRTLQNKNFCINGLPAFTSNYTDPSQSTQLSKLASKLAKIRQFKIKGQSHKTDSRKNEFATVHKLNLQTRKTCNQSSALGQETADRSSPTILSSRAPLIIKCNDWTSIAGQVFQIPSSLKIHSISSKKLVRSMTPS